MPATSIHTALYRAPMVRGKIPTSVRVQVKRRHYTGPWYAARVSLRSGGDTIATYRGRHMRGLPWREIPAWLQPIVDDLVAKWAA